MNTIVVIGAGFSGAVTTCHLLRAGAPGGLRVVLLNRSGPMARGLAYGTRSAGHLLNVPAGNMSALADDPDHFLAYCRRSDPNVTAASFVPRAVYGDYLEWLLDEAETHAAPGAVLERLATEAVRVDEAPAGGATVLLADSREIAADHVVLAFGHFPARDPVCADPVLLRGPRYVRDPWQPGAFDAVGRGEAVLLLGNGLTAVDVALSLAQDGRAGRIHTLSRRGLMPQPHRSLRTAVVLDDLPELLDAMGNRVRRYVRALRRYADRHVDAGGDWRDVLAALRPHTPALWQRLDEGERRRFLRHVQAFWDVHRHRVAPVPYARLQGLLASGVLQPTAGRLVELRENGGGVEVKFRARHSGQLCSLQVARVINCTGPDPDLGRVDAPLVRHLLATGLIRQDPQHLGLEVSPTHAVIHADGSPSEALHYVGPLLKARYWEAMAVPELRVHTKTLAAGLIAQIARSAA